MQTADGRAEGHADASLNGSGSTTARVRLHAPGERSAMAILRSIVEDLGTLVRGELRLAQQEILAGLVARGVGIGALVVAGVMALFGMTFLALAAAAALALVVPVWAALLIVALGFLSVAAAGALFARVRFKAAPMAEETKRTIKEDVEWAKAQLGR